MWILKKGSKVPFEIGHLICDCSEPKWKQDRDLATRCLRCDKIMFVFARKCQDCEKWFINDFNHPMMCNMYPTCWDCTEKCTVPICETIPSKIEHYYCRRKYLEKRPPDPRLLEERSRDLDLTIPDLSDFDLTF